MNRTSARAAGDPPGKDGPPLYASPDIYDVAFGWDVTLEIDFLESCFAAHAPGPVRSILEPACGSGRIMAALAERGFEVSGYDLSPEMVAYAGAKLSRRGGRVMRGDMASFAPPGRYDAALNLVNSIGYLLEDSAVSAHLARVARVLHPGGVYIVQLNYGGEPPELNSFGPWPNASGDIRTALTWRVVREDAAERRSYQECRIEVTRGASRRTIEESHVLRYWTQEDFDRILAGSPFELAAVYYDRFEEHPIELPRTGDYGNLYHVLRLRGAR